MPEDGSDGRVLPKQPVRRFDVFAEVKRLEALADGRPEEEAKGYGIWIAKVVAGRRFGARRRDAASEQGRIRQEGEPAADDRPESRFRHAGDELQTDETFDREIIERMGRRFYERVFAPTIRSAIERGERYEQFRDSIRAGWKPPRP